MFEKWLWGPVFPGGLHCDKLGRRERTAPEKVFPSSPRLTDQPLPGTEPIKKAAAIDVQQP